MAQMKIVPMRVLNSQHCLGPNVYPEVPDGGWGWAVAMAFFLVEVCTYGIIKSLGVFLQDLMKEFGESNSRVSWVISICVFIFTFTAPLSTMLSNRFGTRPVVMTGGFLISLGTISSAFTNSINEMYITIGIVSGLGYCLTFLPTVTILAQYFSRRRALVTSVASSGESFAIFAFAPDLRTGGAEDRALMEWGAQDKEGQEPSPSLPLTPVKEKDEGELAEPEAGPLQPSSPKLLDFSVLKDSSFIWYSLFGLFATLGFFAPQLYIIELSKSRDIEPSMASYMLSVMAVAEIFGRLSIGVVLNRVRCRKTLVLLGCVVLLFLVLVAFTVVWEFWGLAVCCALYGYFMGTVGSTHIPMLAEEDVVGIQKMASSVGVYVFIQSFAGLAGPPLGGVLVDVTHNYGAAFYSCAVGIGLSAICLAMAVMSKSGMCQRQRGNKEGGTEEGEKISQNSDQPDFLEVDLALEDSPGCGSRQLLCNMNLTKI
ncbi:solute carrier family 16 member 6b isoform X2 [Pempheris klunzingeri]|uniref:solute carrier family 16 member 6b isoform X2 n=1 Tax=Pempheris klunzingeri TaxID=3127111 RepID=UPI00397F5195